jgi:filamentous hemagglutinin family protein
LEPSGIAPHKLRVAGSRRVAGLGSRCLGKPENGQVVGGQATITNTAPNTLTINQATPKAAIDWQSFNIAPDETTQFVQPSANAIALNRVKAGDPSVIAGRLTANGQLVLINPSGIVFSKGAQVDVNALLATTTNISTDNFMAGRMVFDQPSTDPRAKGRQQRPHHRRAEGPRGARRARCRQ